MPKMSSSGKYNEYSDRSLLFMKEDVDLIFISLQNLFINEPTDVKRISSLLESLSSIFISNKSNQTTNFNFKDNILFLNKLLNDINHQAKTKEDLHKKKLTYELQLLILQNLRNLLKINNDLTCDSFPILFENLIDYLIQTKENICKSVPELESDIIIVFENISLILLKCIYLILSKYTLKFDELNKTNICGKLIGILRCFSFYGLEKYELNKLSIHLYPSPIGQIFPGDTEASIKKKRGKLDEDELLEDDTLFNSSSISISASEYSSSEMDEDSIRDSKLRHERHNKKIYAKIRMLCYESIQSALTIFGIRTFFGFWSFLFPDSPDFMNNTQFSVLFTISKDNSNRVRTSALNFMYNFFFCAKHYIRTLVSESAVSKPSSSKAFTPLSASLTSMVKELHNFFDYILLKESSSSILILLYKVISLIITITPYHKLHNDILIPLFYRNSFLLDHKVTQIKILSFVLYVKIFSSESVPKELHSWLVENKLGNETINKIVKYCLELIETMDFILLSIESIKLLTSIIKHHELMLDLLNSSAVKIDLKTICMVSIRTSENHRSLNNQIFQSLICKFIYSIGMLLKLLTLKDTGIFENNDEKMEFTKQWFLNLFDSKLFKQALIDQEMSLVKSSSQVALINVISLIPDKVFTLICPNTRYHLISILVSLARSELPEQISSNEDDSNLQLYTKSASIRCLSILQSYSCISDDINLIFDLIEICLEALDEKPDRNKNQKKKEIVLLEHSLWALANICDVIKKNNLESEIDYFLLNKMLTSLCNGYDINYIKYHTDYILVNLVRCSGLVVYIILNKQLTPGDSILAEEDADLPKLLPKDTKTMVDQSILLKVIVHIINLLRGKKLYKLQWNICISFSYLFTLENFVDLCRNNFENEESLLIQIYKVLFNIFANTTNHKVQSYSIYTICSVPNLDYLDQFLSQLWSTIVNKFIDNFSIVSVQSQHSWLEKYIFAIEKLYLNIVDKHPSTVDKAEFDKLVSFVEFRPNWQDFDKDTLIQMEKLDCILARNKLS